MCPLGLLGRRLSGHGFMLGGRWNALCVQLLCNLCAGLASNHFHENTADYRSCFHVDDKVMLVSRIGSGHTPSGYIWHIALAMQGLTETDQKEKEKLLDMLTQTTGGKGMMHEGFCKDDPTRYTRIVKIGQRKGDGALEVLLELV